MTSVSNITRQYANLQSRRNQKQSGGAQAIAAAPAPEPGIFDNIFGGDKKAEPAVPAKVEPESTSILEKLGFSSSVDESKKDEDGATNAANVAGADASADASADAVDLGATEAPKKEESLLQKLGITSAESSTPEPAAAAAAVPAAVTEPVPAAVTEPVPEPEPATAPAPAADAPDGEKKSMFENLKAAVGLAPSDDKKPEVEESDSGDDNLSSESESESEDDDNDSDFKLVVDKMENLRKKYEDLKAKYKEEIKKKHDEPAASKDNTDFSNILASYFAIEGSLKQLKIYLKKHADKNGYPVEGLGLDTVEGEEAAPEPVVSAPAPEASVPAPEASEVVPEPEPAPEASAPEASAPEAEASAPEASEPAPEASEVVPEPEASASAPEPEASAVAPVEGAVSDSESDASSGSGSGSESEPEPALETSSIPEIPVDGSSPGSVESAPKEAPAAGGTNPLFSGGRNHFIQNIRKNKTHRHHKRRNRHQTLRNNHSK